MASAVSETDIYNRALTKLGSDLITSTSQNIERARTMDSLYAICRDRVRRECAWNFAIKRDTLSADATAPEFDWDSRFALPNDFIMMIETDNQSKFRVEGPYLFSNEANSLKIKYLYRNEDTSTYDTVFIEALAALMAYEACEKITQSNTKKAELLRDYTVTVQMGKQRDGQEDDAVEEPEDSWLTARF